MKISIIIPAYNCKDTLDVALSSIEKQKIDVSFDVIIVNDASGYDYKDFINKYNKFNIREINTKKNVGPGGSRQYGIDNSKSEYIIFLDSDDYFYDDNSVKKLYETITNTNSDIVISNFIFQRDNKELVKKKDPVWLHGKIYRRSFLEKNNIKFNNTRANEDNSFNRLILCLGAKYYLLDEITYVYKENSESITRKNNREYKFTGLEGYTYNMNWVLDELLKRGLDLKSFKILILGVLVSLYMYYLDLDGSYDVGKIIEWSKNLKDKYDLVKKYISNEDIEEKIKDEEEYLKDELNIKEYKISFDEFLSKY